MSPGSDLLELSGMDYQRLQDLSRILTFYAGTTPRAVVTVMQPGPDGQLRVDNLAAAVNQQLPSCVHDALPFDLTLLFDELLRLLVAANQALFDRLRAKDGGCDIMQILTEPWEELKAVQSSDVLAAWSSLAQAQGWPRARDENYLYSLVEVLADAGLASLRLDPGTAGVAVWPATAAQLVYDSQGMRAVPEELWKTQHGRCSRWSVSSGK